MQPFSNLNRITYETVRKTEKFLKEKKKMNKKFISLLIGASMLAASVPVMATTEGIVQGDILLTSVEDTVVISENPTSELNTYTGVVKAIEESRVTVSIEDVEYAFILAEGVELGDIAVDDSVQIKSASALNTKDIKEATAITKLVATPDIAPNNYNSYNGVVKSVDEGAISVVIDEVEVSFVTTEDTFIVSADENVTDVELKEGDNVVVVSTSLLLTKDVKFADAIVVEAEAEQSVFVDKFDIVEDQLISADGNLVVNVENKEEYAGKKLLVLYSVTTMSIPPQAIPNRIIVMPEEKEVSISFTVGSKELDINDKKVEVEIAPYIVGEGTTLVPLRVISEAFGAKVGWDGETQTVIIVDTDTEIMLQIGNKTAFVNGEAVEMEEAPELLGSGVTTVPLRFVSETFKAEVNWDESQLVTVSR